MEFPTDSQALTDFINRVTQDGVAGLVTSLEERLQQSVDERVRELFGASVEEMDRNARLSQQAAEDAAQQGRDLAAVALAETEERFSRSLKELETQIVHIVRGDIQQETHVAIEKATK